MGGGVNSSHSILKSSRRRTELDPAPHVPVENSPERPGGSASMKGGRVTPDTLSVSSCFRASWGSGSTQTTEAALVAGQAVLGVQAWGAPAISRLLYN